jgi:hypothetical protein
MRSGWIGRHAGMKREKRWAAKMKMSEFEKVHPIAKKASHPRIYPETLRFIHACGRRESRHGFPFLPFFAFLTRVSSCVFVCVHSLFMQQLQKIRSLRSKGMRLNKKKGLRKKGKQNGNAADDTRELKRWTGKKKKDIR